MFGHSVGFLLFRVPHFQTVQESRWDSLRADKVMDINYVVIKS